MYVSKIKRENKKMKRTIGTQIQQPATPEIAMIEKKLFCLVLWYVKHRHYVISVSRFTL